MSEFGDAIKKINARLRVLEKRGLTGTWEYTSLKARIQAAAPGKTFYTSDGHLAISGRNINKEQRQAIMTISRNKALTATHAEQRLYEAAKQAGITGPRRVAIREQARLENDIHMFIYLHRLDIYKISYFDHMIKSGKPMTRAQAHELLNMYNSSLWQAYTNQQRIDNFVKGRHLSADMLYKLDMLDDLQAEQSRLGESVKWDFDLDLHILALQKQIQQDLLK